MSQNGLNSGSVAEFPQSLVSRTRGAVNARRSARGAEHHARRYEADGDAERAAEALALAEEQHDAADGLLRREQPIQVLSGEAVVRPAASPRNQYIADTLAEPSQVAIDASSARTNLLVLVQTDVLALGVDAAQSIKAKNSLEKMLAHQLALIHSVAMRTMDKALLAKGTDGVGLLNATARLMSVYQQGLLTVQKLRSKGAQTVTVRHVHVHRGGQAVIGNVTPGGAKRDRRSNSQTSTRARAKVRGEDAE